MECRRMCTFSVPALFLPSWEDPVIWTIGYRLFFRACVRHPREGCPYRVSLASLKESESVEGGSILRHHWQIAVPRPLGIGVGPRPTCPFWFAYSSSVEFFLFQRQKADSRGTLFCVPPHMGSQLSSAPLWTPDVAMPMSNYRFSASEACGRGELLPPGPLVHFDVLHEQGLFDALVGVVA